jgi:probable addiction module antidote protein
MATKTKPFDAARYFKTPAAQARLIDDALASGDAGYIANALGVIARARGMTELARDTGLARPALYAALSEDGNPTLETVLKVVRALGIELHASEAKQAA